MTKIAFVSASTVVDVFPLADGETELAIRYTMPNGAQVSPVSLGWSRGSYHVLEVVEFVVPEGKRISGPVEYTVDPDGFVIENYPVEDVTAERTMVRKSIVQQRLIDAGKMDEAYAALTANPTYFARWFAPDRPQVYCDDPDALLLLQAIGADPEVIMAVE